MRAHVEGLLREALANHPCDRDAAINEFFGLWDCSQSWMMRGLKERAETAEAGQWLAFGIGCLLTTLISVTAVLL